MSSNAIKVGLRVVRGVDWEWGNQDGGEGSVGTVIEIGGQGSSKNPENTVVVIWDTGIRANYRVGYQGKDDLRMFDNGPAGVRHGSVTCDICRLAGICGIRWKCTQCDDFDLCHNCYVNNKHDPAHVFLRFDTPLSHSVKVAPRSKSRRVQAKGLYPGAKVQRGPDWLPKYGDQDGGSGQFGTIATVGDASDGSSWRSWVKVKWAVGRANDYRRGYEGKHDVKCTTPANGELYFVDHLPKLGDYGAHCFADGDHVRFNPDTISDSDRAALMMSGVLYAIGEASVSDDGQRVTVTFSDTNSSFTVSSSHLLKVRQLAVGDTVKIMDNAQTVQKLQKGHGGWNSQMASSLNKIGKVIAIDSDGDVKVDFGNAKWTFNPACCTLVSEGQSSRTSVNTGTENNDDDDDDNNGNDAMAGFVDLMSLLMGLQYAGLNPESLVKEAAEGHAEKVKMIIAQFPNQVNIKVQNRTALQCAAHQGHQQIVVMLLLAGAKSDIQDEDGDTAFHYAVYGNKHLTLEILLKKSTTGIDILNKNGRSSLHVAVCKQHADCVSVLLKYKCNVNTQDNEGDTPLHDAVNRDSNSIVDSLIKSGSIDYKLQNNKGFNVLHQAALRGHQYALDKMVRMAPQFVNVPKHDGFTPLHIAAYNGYVKTAATLIEQGKANLEMTTGKFQTPLLVAVENGQAATIELLVENGANLEAEDGDGDTALHLVLLQLKNSRQAASVMTLMLNVLFQVQPKSIEKAPTINKICAQFGAPSNAQNAWLAIACYLVSKGADIDHKNQSNISPIDEVTDQRVKDVLKHLSKPKAEPAVISSKAPVLTSSPKQSNMCMMCTSEPVAVTFRPCGHQVACSQCSSRMKQCFSCHERIQEKVRIDIKAHVSPTPRQAAANTSNNASSSSSSSSATTSAPADTVNCPLCERNVRNVVFQCGHSCCSDCSNNKVKANCHVCGVAIQKRINLF